MLITIGTLTSTVNVGVSSSVLTEAMLEQIVTLVMMRLRQERYAEEQLQQEREIRDRMSEPEFF